MAEPDRSSKTRPGEAWAHYEIHQDLNLLVARFGGKLRGKDFLTLYEEAYSHAEYRHGMDEFVDLSFVEHLDFSQGSLRMIDDLVRGVYRDRSETFRTAFYAPSALAFGMSRMYEVVSSAGAESVNVFQHASAALEWLGVPGERWADIG